MTNTNTVRCINDRYTREADEFSSVEEFLDMCRSVFGEVPSLTPEGGSSWQDETGETVLVRAALTTEE